MPTLSSKLMNMPKLVWIKISLLFLNLFFWVAGLTLMCVGASVELNLSDVSVVIKDVTSGAAVVLIIVGILIFFLSFFGCVSVIGENTTLIKVFSILLFFMFLVEIGVGVSSYVYREGIHRSLVDLYLQTLQKYPIDTDIQLSVDRLQKQLHCCGAVGYTDWFNTTLQHIVPDSCCIQEKPLCGSTVSTNGTTYIYTQGCIAMVGSWVHEHNILIGGVGVGLGFLQVVGMVFGFLLMKSLQAEYESM
ncbi:CD63 antigen isoform X1 [Amia ocellicauda]|uniref:CD63 antigen isoform X1 n=1 Tax=Amia ocellicauda TaxID=2972642 RepID=UPI003463E96A